MSFSLGDNIEDLKLIGPKAIKATGNSLDNNLEGNGNDNIIEGGAGEDFLRGHGGDDRLIGGADLDFFCFEPGWGVDRIVDFEDGIDVILSSDVRSQADVDALDIGQHGDDTVIDFGRGSRLIIEGPLKTDLTVDDFL